MITMTKEEKKAYAWRLIDEGDERSYNEIMADLELLIWTSQYKNLDVIPKKEEENRTGETE